MMGEIGSSFKINDVAENRNRIENYKNIKPETSITTQECRDFLKEKC